MKLNLTKKDLELLSLCMDVAWSDYSESKGGTAEEISKLQDKISAQEAKNKEAKK